MIGKVLCWIGAGMLLACFAGIFTAVWIEDWRAGVWLTVFFVGAACLLLGIAIVASKEL